MSTPAYFIRALLGSSGGLVSLPSAGEAWPCYTVNMPDGEGVKADVVCCYDEDGIKQGRLMGSGEVIERANVQILIRSTDYRTGHALMKALALYMDSIKRKGIDLDGVGFFIPSITRSSMFPMGLDETQKKRRYMFSLNCDFQIKNLGVIADLPSDSILVFEPVDSAWFIA